MNSTKEVQYIDVGKLPRKEAERILNNARAELGMGPISYTYNWFFGLFVFVIFIHFCANLVVILHK